MSWFIVVINLAISSWWCRENLCRKPELLYLPTLAMGGGVHTYNNSLFLIAARRAERNHREDEGDGTKQWSLFRHSNCEFWSWQGISRVTSVNKQTWHRAPVGTLYLATMRENHSKGQMDFNLVIILRGSYVGLLSSSKVCELCRPQWLHPLQVE